jgi:hypothetical protein
LNLATGTEEPVGAGIKVGRLYGFGGLSELGGSFLAALLRILRAGSFWELPLTDASSRATISRPKQQKITALVN